MKYIFITGSGRSGTSFTSKVLSKSENCIAQHEFMGDYEFSLQSRYLDGDNYAIPYLEKEKSKIEREFNADTFIDVSTHLKNVVPSLEKVFTGCKIYHLVRDPKQVVRSIYVRRSARKTHELPFDKDEIEKWMSGDKFYRCCWNWADWAKLLLNQNTHLLNFEKLTGSYQYFDKNLLQPNGIELSEENWISAQSQKRNKTRSKLFRSIYSRIKGKELVTSELPEYENWTAEQKRIFEEVCGETAVKCGYTI